MTNSNKKTVNFEATLKELETIVQKLESNELNIDEALNQFETGINLANQGQEYLKNAEQRIKILLQKNNVDSLQDYPNADDNE